MIRTNSGVQVQKLQIPLQQMSPFNAQIRYSNPYSETPSTPSKSFINQLRGSQTFTPVKNQQTFALKENNFTIESKIQSLVNENLYLNQQLDKARNELENFEKQNHNLQQIKQRVQKLEDLVDRQQSEIETWKLKYQKAAAGDSRIELQQMESQILNVIQENERLNKLVKELEEQNNQKDLELKTIIQKNICLENEQKKQKEKSKNIEKANKPAVQWCAFQAEKKGLKSSTGDLRQSKGKLNDNEIQNRKKSEHTVKQILRMEVDLNDLEKQVLQLEHEKQELQNTIIELQCEIKKIQDEGQKFSEDKTETQLSNYQNNILILKQEVQNQQILILEEFKKFKVCQQQNLQMKEKFYQFEEFLKAFNSTLPQSEEINIDTAIEEFQSSQANCLKILDQIEKK